ncbi:6,7-dimethyl-8-ribityllumazine synthase [Balamuthia mandrillaris]
MATAHLAKDVPKSLKPPANAHQLRVGLIRTAWNEGLVLSLHDRCKAVLTAVMEETSKASASAPSDGNTHHNIREEIVAGSFELPYAAQKMAASGSVDVVLCFGVLVKGDTMHFEYISQAVSNGLMEVQLRTGVPVIYGVLNCLTVEQAQQRCGPQSPLPTSLALTALNMAALKVSSSSRCSTCCSTCSNKSAPLRKANL